MADDWYYTSQGQQLGPVSTDELRRYADAGRLDPADLVWKDGMPRWVHAHAVPEFAPVPSSPSSVPEAAPRRGQDSGRDRREPVYDEDAPRPRRRQAAAPQGMSTGAKVAIGLGIGGGVLFVIVVLLVVLVIVTARTTTTYTTTPPPPQFGGATFGPKTWRLNFGPRQKQSWLIEFRSGGPARFWIIGLNRTDVEIRVFDTTNNVMVASSTAGVSDLRDVAWQPPVNRTYRVEVWNKDMQRWNDVEMRHN